MLIVNYNNYVTLLDLMVDAPDKKSVMIYLMCCLQALEKGDYSGCAAGASSSLPGPGSVRSSDVVSDEVIINSLVLKQVTVFCRTSVVGDRRSGVGFYEHKTVCLSIMVKSSDALALRLLWLDFLWQTLILSCLTLAQEFSADISLLT